MKILITISLAVVIYQMRAAASHNRYAKITNFNRPSYNKFTNKEPDTKSKTIGLPDDKNGYSNSGIQVFNIRTGCDNNQQSIDVKKKNIELPKGYKLYPEVGAYKLHKKKVTWMDARRACRQEGAHLAVADTYMELDAMVKVKGKVSEAWVGFHDLFVTGEWVTVHDNIALLKWVIHNPDNLGRERCGSLQEEGNNNLICELPHPYICEIDIYND